MIREFLFTMVSLCVIVDSQFQFNFGQQYNPYHWNNQFNMRPQNFQSGQQSFAFPTMTIFPNRVTNNGLTTNTNPTSHRPQEQGVQNLRISEKKCKEYTERAKNPVLVGSLAFIPSIQGINTDQCDASQGLIVGGEQAKPGEFPHMAALGYPNLDEINYQCGGSLISDRYVLTAAHCRVANRVKPTVVRLGDHNLKLKEPNIPEKNVLIEKFISHEQYDPTSSKNDIALIR